MCDYSLCPNGRPSYDIMLEIEWRGRTFRYCSALCAREDLRTMTDPMPEPDAYDEDAPLPDEDEDGPEFPDREVQDNG